MQPKKIISTINYNTRKGMFFEKFQNRNEAKQKIIYYTNFAVPKNQTVCLNETPPLSLWMAITIVITIILLIFKLQC